MDTCLITKHGNALNKGDVICSFKHLHLKRDGKVISGLKWRTAKAKELLAFFLHHHNNVIKKKTIVEKLWPHCEEGRATQYLYNAIHYIRSIFNEVDFDVEILKTVDGYELILNNVFHDVSLWKSCVMNTERLNHDLLTNYEKVMRLYQHDYLRDEPYTWKENKADRLRILYIKKMYQLIDYFIEKDHFETAIYLTLRLQNNYPYLQKNFHYLMILYNEIGDYYNVEKQYNNLVMLMERRFNKIPIKSIQDWFKNWNKDYSVLVNK